MGYRKRKSSTDFFLISCTANVYRELQGLFLFSLFQSRGNPIIIMGVTHRAPADACSVPVLKVIHSW